MDTLETSLFATILITSVVVGIIILYFALTITRSHRRHFTKLRSYYLQEVELLEKERMRIARDLHDELGPLLTVTQILVSVSQGTTEKDREQLRKATDNLQNLHERFSGVARNLTPKILISKGLVIALKDFSAQMEELGSAKINTLCQLNKEPSASFSMQIYRIAQELLHNGTKHAFASKIDLLIREQKRKMLISYEDDGRGFSLNAETEKGLGLSSVRNRVVMLGGTIEILSSPGEGVSIFILIPIQSHERK
jgi:signal transduction histidine kinase